MRAKQFEIPLDASQRILQVMTYQRDKLVLLPFNRSSLSDVFHSKHKDLCLVNLSNYSTRIQNHHTSANVRKRVPNFEPIEMGVSRENVLQECAQRLAIPLAIAKLIHQLVLSIPRRHLEGLIK